MRIVSGVFRSRSLKTLKGDNTRPTSDKIRAAIFDSIAFESNYKTMLDLFSGSGAMGLEAISRGFTAVILNDKSREAVKIIRENVKDLDCQSQCKVMNDDYKYCLKKSKPVDLMFVDPPYDKVDLEEIVRLSAEYKLINDDGMIIIETSSQTNLKEEINEFYISKIKDYKSTRIIYYRKR